MFNKAIFAFVFACSVVSVPAHAEPLTTDAVVQMTKAGLGYDAIIAKVKSENRSFDLTTEQMIALRQQGVTSSVIAAMLNNSPTAAPALSLTSPDPNVPHPPGLYLLSGEGANARTQRIDPTASSQAKTGGLLGYALTGGIASMSVKVAITNDAARTRATTGKPRFYMFFDESNNAAATSTWASGFNTVVTSPAEFNLIRLNKKDGRREARVGSVNLAGAKSGIMDKDRLSFGYQMIRPGVYQVDVSTPLPPGEYGFMFSIGGGGTSGAMTARIFDFGVE